LDNPFETESFLFSFAINKNHMSQKPTKKFTGHLRIIPGRVYEVGPKSVRVFDKAAKKVLFETGLDKVKAILPAKKN
jgi:hypothetical protein